MKDISHTNISFLTPIIDANREISTVVEIIQQRVRENKIAEANFRIGYLIACCDNLKTSASNLFRSLNEKES